MRICLSFMVLLWSSIACAHGRLPETYEVLWHPTDSNRMAINTTFGLLLTDDGGTSWRWVCRDAMSVSQTRDPPFLLAEGAVVGAVFDGMLRGALDGCAWGFPAAELERVVMIDLVPHPTTSTTMFALTSSGGGFINSLYRSIDSGETWAPTGNPIEPILFEKVRVAPSRPERIYLSGTYPRTAEEDVRRPFFYRSDDSGETFDVIPFEFREGDRNIFVMAVDPNDADTVYMRVSHDVERSDLAQRLIRSRDGGDTWESVFELPDLRALALSDDGTMWVGGRFGSGGPVAVDDAGIPLDSGVPLAPGRGLWRSVDGGDTFEQLSDSLEVGCLHVHEGVLWLCASAFQNGFAVGRSLDGGETFTPFFDFGELLGPVECEGEVRTTCMRADNDIHRDLGLCDGGPCPDGGLDAGPDAGGGTSGGGCGCRTSSSSSFVAFVVVIWITRLRRRP